MYRAIYRMSGNYRITSREQVEQIKLNRKGLYCFVSSLIINKKLIEIGESMFVCAIRREKTVQYLWLLHVRRLSITRVHICFTELSPNALSRT